MCLDRLMVVCLLLVGTGCVRTMPQLDMTCPPLPPIPSELAAPPMPLEPLVPQANEERSLLSPDFWRINP